MYGWYKRLKYQMPASPSDLPAWTKVTDPSRQSQLPAGRSRLGGLGEQDVETGGGVTSKSTIRLQLGLHE